MAERSDHTYKHEDSSKGLEPDFRTSDTPRPEVTTRCLSASVAGESRVSVAGSVWFSPPAEHVTSQEGAQRLLPKGRPVFDKWPEKKKNNFMLLNLTYGGVLVFEESIIQ